MVNCYQVQRRQYLILYQHIGCIVCSVLQFDVTMSLKEEVADLTLVAVTVATRYAYSYYFQVDNVHFGTDNNTKNTYVVWTTQ